MQKSFIFSAILHLFIMLLVLFGLPSFFSKNITDDHIVTVEILPISEFTNVKTPKVKPKIRPIEEKKKEVSSATEPKKALPDPTFKPKPQITPDVVAKPKPEKPKEVIKTANIEPLAKPKPIEKQKPKPEPKKEEPKEPELTFDSVLKTVEEIVPEQEKSQNQEEEAVNFDDIEQMLTKPDEKIKYKPGLPMSLSEKDAIRQQIMRNWSLSSASGGKDAQSMVVTLNIKLARDGTVLDIDVQESLRYNTDGFFRAMADSAIRAVHKSSPLKNLPPEKYDTEGGWRELEINFDPRDMFF